MATEINKDLAMVCVQWSDAVGNGDWVPPSGPFQLEETISVGFLVKETEEFVVICRDIGSEKI